MKLTRQAGMLYDAVPDPKADKLEVTKFATSSFGRQNPITTKKYLNFKQSFDYIDVPIYLLLGRFGHLIPEASSYSKHESSTVGGPPTEVVKVQSVCFNTLHDIAQLNIEWVTSLALHLELDSGNKTLKLFQFPSFCRMMSVDRDNHILSR